MNTLLLRRGMTLLFLLGLTSLSAMSAPIWHEVSIPTRAPAPKNLLLADVYDNDSITAKPVILIQTPYNKALYRLSLSSVLTKSGASVPYDSSHYNYVIVDWRGFYANKAQSITPYDRGQDGYDIVEWIAAQPWCNGKVGTWGGSALGMIQFQTAAQHPPHLVCSAPFIKDFATTYENDYYGGDFRLEQIEALETLGFTTVSTVLAHPTYDNTWKFVENQSLKASAFAVPMFMCSGWFDHYPDDVLHGFSDLQSNSDVNVRAKHKLMFGPFEHTRVGLPTQGILTFPGVEGLPTQLGMQFFDFYLRGQANGWDTRPVIQYYQMGDNVWKTTDSWPLKSNRSDTLFFHPDHVMNTTPPPPILPPVVVDKVPGDPRNPVPTIGGSRFTPTDKTTPSGPQDIRQLLSRSDQWYYQTDALTAPIVISGESNVHLHLSSTTKDADVCARLCDIYPDGSWIILTQGVQRLRLRNSLSTEELMPLNQMQVVSLHFQNTAQTFLAGHRIGILITTSDYPMFDLNINDGGPMYSSGDTTKTELSISHDDTEPSFFVYSTNNSANAVNETTSAATDNIQIMPNPTTKNATVAITLSDATDVQVQVLDMLGREVIPIRSNFLSAGTNSLELQLPELPSQPLLLNIRTARATFCKTLQLVH